MSKLAIIDQCVSAGGVERFVQGLVQGILELPVSMDWDITIILNRYNTAGYEVKWPERIKGSRIHVRYIFDDNWGRYFHNIAKHGRVWGIPGTGIIKWVVFLVLARLWIERDCRCQRYDVVYFPYPYMMSCPNIPMPLVATYHDFNWKHKQFHSASYFGGLLWDRQTRGWLRKCYRPIVSSEFIAGELRRFYPSFDNKVRVVRVGIPSANHIPTQAELKVYREHVELRGQFLLTVGWILPHKNQMVLFEALRELRNRGTKIPIVFAGPNSDKLRPDIKEPRHEYIKETIRLADRLGFKYGQDYIGLGYVREFDLDCLYRLSTVLLVPALYEAGSFPILEAVKALCPVICSKIPSYIEQDDLLGNNLWLFDPHNATILADRIEQLLRNPVTTGEKAKLAGEMLEQAYSWNKAAAAYLNIFREALKSGKMA